MLWHRLLWLALLSIPMFALAAACSSDSAAPSTLDAPGFQAAYDELGTLRERALADDLPGVGEAFENVHVFTRLVDGALLELPAEVLTRAALIDAVAGIEQELRNIIWLERLADRATEAQQALAAAAQALGIEPPQDK